VGFLACYAGSLDGGGVVILAAGYDPVADEDYLEDRTVGARLGPGAFRRALQRAFNGGRKDLGLFHVHMHDHPGIPALSGVDRRESARFVPDFFNASPGMPHGVLVLSRDVASGLCWHSRSAPPCPIDTIVSVGAPLCFWKHAA